MEDISESILDILDALRDGDKIVLEKYYLSNHKLVNDILLDVTEVNPSLIEYLLNKNDIMIEDLNKSSDEVVSLLYLNLDDLDSYEKVLKLINYDVDTMLSDIQFYVKTVKERSNQYELSKRNLLNTINRYENKIK